MQQRVTAKPAAVAGSREREGSPWLGRSAPPSETLLNYQVLERSLGTLWPSPGPDVAPATALGALIDWSMHVALSPAKQWELAHFGAEQWARWFRAALALDDADAWVVDPLPQDKRFADPQWRQRPFVWLAQAFLLRQEWWQRATTAVPGVSHHHEAMVEFAARQWLDMVAPSNSVLANPLVLRQTLRERGANLVRGSAIALEDGWRAALDLPPAGAEAFRLGADVAATPRPRRAAQPADRADPVRADDAERAPRAGAAGVGVDHEVLHPRPRAAQLDGEVPASTTASRCSPCRGRTRRPRTATSASTTTTGSASRPRSTRSARSCRAGRRMRSATASAARCWR